MKEAMPTKRIPFGDKPLSSPGHSLETQVQDFASGRISAWVACGLFTLLLIGAEWVRWLAGDTIRPIPYTIAGIGFLLFIWWNFRQAKQEEQNLRTGLLDEIHTGHYLQNALLCHNYWVVHDIPGDSVNIDHALIGPGGVFAIETKTRTKDRGNARATYDGEQILVDGFAPDRDPVTQAKAAARHLHEILLWASGKTVFVRPVVLFPGWLVEKQPPGAETWVLNEQAFAKFVENEPQRLSKEEVFVLAAGLGRYVREQEEK